VADARSPEYDERYRPYTDSEVEAAADGFNFQEFRSNVVFRWEYRPGSTLFLVWSQGRQYSSDTAGDMSFGQSLTDELFGQRADNTFLLKVSYWFSR
jgi:hypothetical protein